MMRSCISASSAMWKFIFPIIVIANTARSSDPDYFDNLRRFNDELAANATSSKGTLSYSYSATANGGWAKSAASSLFPILKPKESIGNNIHTASSFANPGNIPGVESRFSDGNGGAASASGYIGNGQVRQSASVYPQNPSVPNVNTRFGADTGKGGSYGVFTSSFSETLPDSNGKPVTRQKASTTVNDNGKVSSYSAHNP
ncbi:uncharacterized protein LOC108740654 isoform X3 [Agrilus planipennis]|uniref:Uncharacterized protein LOC108740654 isoform X3 n=1 Tax=Agrilus planipennis TaxID=224129 RepID=A0A1W4XCL4_AGRPL|nr:uncharacterized protein LOC108740654 isoform X3 [Agrilus planipennis]